jgi:hypothetical protein
MRRLHWRGAVRVGEGSRMMRRNESGFGVVIEFLVIHGMIELKCVGFRGRGLAGAGFKL